jgi:hypothetical protein
VIYCDILICVGSYSKLRCLKEGRGDVMSKGSRNWGTLFVKGNLESVINR